MRAPRALDHEQLRYFGLQLLVLRPRWRRWRSRRVTRACGPSSGGGTAAAAARRRRVRSSSELLVGLRGGGGAPRGARVRRDRLRRGRAGDQTRAAGVLRRCATGGSAQRRRCESGAAAGPLQPRRRGEQHVGRLARAATRVPARSASSGTGVRVRGGVSERRQRRQPRPCAQPVDRRTPGTERLLRLGNRRCSTGAHGSAWTGSRSHTRVCRAVPRSRARGAEAEACIDELRRL